jgi:hypothetical protein
MALTSLAKYRWAPWFLGVLAAALVERTVLWLFYPPATFHDTGGYRRLADTILGGWKFYDGTRVPGYPQWMAWLGSDAAVYFSQLLLGLAITLGFFFVGWQVSRSPVFGAVAALAHTLNLGQVFFETDLLSETLATFWLMLALGCVFLAIYRKIPHLWLAWLGAGLFSALAGITRTLYLFMPFWIGLFLALAGSGWPFTRPAKGRLGFERRAICFNFRPLLLASLPAILIIGAWVGFLYEKYRILSVTTMGGLHLVQHTGQWFELLPDEDAVLRDIYLQHRATQIAATGTSGNTIWDALPDMENATGLGFFQISDVMAQLSLKLIWEHPERYLLSVLDGWQLYWRVPFYWEPQAIASPGLRAAAQLLASAERGGLIAANLVFLVSSLMALFSRRWRERLGISTWWVFVLATLWLTSIVQTLPDHGDNPRFLAPQQSWVVLWVLWVGYKTWSEYRARKNYGIEEAHHEGTLLFRSARREGIKKP